MSFEGEEEISIETRLARREDIGVLANIFIKSFRNDRASQLLYTQDAICQPLVADMIRAYLRDEYTWVFVAEDEFSETILGWVSVSLKDGNEEDYFKHCDSTSWVGYQLLRREAQARGEASMVKRTALINQLRDHNRSGQNRHAGGRRTVLNTVVMDPNEPDLIPEAAYQLIDRIRNLARLQRNPLWAQIPKHSLGNPEYFFYRFGFEQVASFDLALSRYTDDDDPRQRDWGFQKWTQWVLRAGNRGHGRG